MIDNSSKIRSRLDFSGGIFYYLQVLQRKKDNPGQSWMSRQIYSRIIKNLKDFDDSYEIAKNISDLYNARVYIDLSPGSLEKLTLCALKELSERVYNKSYSDTYRIFDKLAPLEETKIKNGKRWMIDVDYKIGSIEFKSIMNYLKGNPKVRIEEEIPTPAGVHIVILPFNYQEAFKGLKLLDNDRNYILPTNETFGLKLNCITILYYGK